MFAGPALSRCSCIGPRVYRGPAPLGPRAMVSRWIVDFFQISVALEKSVEMTYKSHC